MTQGFYKGTHGTVHDIKTKWIDVFASYWLNATPDLYYLVVFEYGRNTWVRGDFLERLP